MPAQSKKQQESAGTTLSAKGRNLECLLDKLSYKIGIAPPKLRMIDYTGKNPENGKIYSSKAHTEYYRIGAEHLVLDAHQVRFELGFVRLTRVVEVSACGKVMNPKASPSLEIVSPIGVKGMGELCLVGIPAAIANAVYHAVGIRVRDLPITSDKLISRHQL